VIVVPSLFVIVTNLANRKAKTTGGAGE